MRERDFSDRPPITAPEAERRRYAEKHRLFWLPCPICDRMFGAQEASRVPYAIAPDPDRPGRGRLVCERCGPEAAKAFQRFRREAPTPVQHVATPGTNRIEVGELGPGEVFFGEVLPVDPRGN